LGHLGILLLRFWRDVGQIAIDPCYLRDRHHRMLRQSAGSACQADTQPIAYLLADGGTATGVERNIATSGWSGHEIFRLAAVGTDQTGLKLRTIPMQACGTQIGPGLRCTVAIDGMNDKPAALLQGDRPLSLDWRSKSGKNEQCGCNKGGNCEG
jgi:hypothetical protein